MKKNRQKHSALFKAQVALEAMREQATVVVIGHRYKINPNLVHKCKKEAVTRMATIVDGHEDPREYDRRAVSTTCLSSRASGTSGARNRHQCR
jgi:transposase-like protein